MRKILSLLLLLPFMANAQSESPTGSFAGKYYLYKNALGIDSIFLLPINDTTVRASIIRNGALVYRPTDQTIYLKVPGFWKKIATGGSVLTPGGANTELQFNDGGVFGGMTGVSYNKATGNIRSGGVISAQRATADSNLLPLGQYKDSAWKYVPYATYNNKKLVVFGSSVAYGTGATSNQGWAYKLGQALVPMGWTLVNKSIPGNNTINLINRFYNDVMPERPDVVIIALGLANEGISSMATVAGKDSVLNQFKTGIYTLVNMCRKAGIRPIVTGAYPYNLYNSVDYTMVKSFNDQMENSDVPFIEFLGAVDDGTGHWRTGMYYDALHPNDIGHEAMFRAIPLGLFDAVFSGTQQRTISFTSQKTQAILIDSVKTASPVMIHPVSSLGSFTASFWYSNSTAAGNNAVVLWGVQLASGVVLRLRCPGSPSTNWELALDNGGSTITIPSNVAAYTNAWHHFAVTYDYYTDIIKLYIDGIAQGTAGGSGRVTGATAVSLGGRPEVGQEIFNAVRSKFSSYTFHRVAFLPADILKLYQGRALKGSSEIITPLSDRDLSSGRNPTNLAYSNTRLLVNTSNNGVFSDTTNSVVGGVTPTLQQVMTAGNTTSTVLNFNTGTGALGSPAMYFRTGGSLRWEFGLSTAENTGNVGSDIYMNTYDNTGTYNATPLTIRRKDSRVSLVGRLLVNGSGDDDTSGLQVRGQVIAGMIRATGRILANGSNDDGKSGLQVNGRIVTNDTIAVGTLTPLAVVDATGRIMSRGVDNSFRAQYGTGIYTDLLTISSGATGIYNSTYSGYPVYMLGNGNVGIGNTSPAVKLDVSGAGQYSGNLTVNGGGLFMSNGTSNRIAFNAVGFAAPSFSSRSAGTKITLFDNLGTTAVDYGIGVESGATWLSVPQATSFYGFNYYGGQTLLARLDGTGKFALGNATAVSTLDVNGSVSAAITSTSGNLTLTAAHHTVRVTAAVTITLPSAASAYNNGAGRIYEIINESAGTVTISSVMVFGTSATSIPTLTSWRVQSDGTNWRLLSRSN